MKDKILRWLAEEFGLDPKIFSKYDFIQKKEQIYICPAGLANIKLRPQQIGLCFARQMRSGLKLTTNAAQLFGKFARKKILDIDKESAIKFIRGEAQKIRTNLRGFVLVRFGKDILGVGKVQNGLLISMVPKGRRLKEVL